MKTVLSWILGVLLVAFVGSGCERPLPEPRTQAEEQSDAQITEQVKVALGESPTFKFPDVQVATYKGKVQLSGFVLTSDQRRAAGDIARGVSGVTEVENNISIKR